MSKGINKEILVGNVGNTETKELINGIMFKASLATGEQYIKDGQKIERTEWHSLVFFGKLADIANQYVSKGDKLYIEGKIQTNRSEKDGEIRYYTSIKVEQMQMLGSKQQKEQDQLPDKPKAPQPTQDDNFEDDEIPF